MSEAFRHLHMPAELAIEFMAVFSKTEYALKGTEHDSEQEGKVTATWDRFAKLWCANCYETTAHRTETMQERISQTRLIRSISVRLFSRIYRWKST